MPSRLLMINDGINEFNILRTKLIPSFISEKDSLLQTNQDDAKSRMATNAGLGGELDGEFEVGTNARAEAFEDGTNARAEAVEDGTNARAEAGTTTGADLELGGELDGESVDLATQRDDGVKGADFDETNNDACFAAYLHNSRVI